MNKQARFLAMLLPLLIPAFVKTEAQETIERHVMVLYFVPLSGASASYSALCADTIAIELERLGYLVMPAQQTREAFRGDALDNNAVYQAAVSLGMDVAVIGFYVVEGSQIRIGVRALDIVAGGAVAVAASESGPAGIEVFETIDAISARIAKRVREALKPIPKAAVTVEREEIRVETTVVEEVVELGTPVTFRLSSADDGAVVAVAGQPFGQIADGFVDLPGKDGEDLIVTIGKEGYHEQELTLPVRASKPSGKAPRLRRVSDREIAFTFGMDRPLGLDAGARFWLVPELLAWQAGVGLFYIPFEYPEFATFGETATILGSGEGTVELPVAGSVRFFPYWFLRRDTAVSPYIELSLSETLLAFPANLVQGEPAFAVFTRLGVGAGLRLRFAGWDLSLDAQLLSPRFLGLGTLSGTKQDAGLRLRLEVSIPW